MDYKLPKQDINTEPFMRQPPPYNHKDVLMRTDKVYKCEITNIVEWKSEKIPEGTQSAVLFKFNSDGLVTEERWFVDTEQWKAAF